MFQEIRIQSMLVFVFCVFILISSHEVSENTKRKLEMDIIDKKLENAVVLSQELLSLIYNRYEMDGPYGAQLFRTINNIAAHDWDIIKYKYAKKIVDSPKGDQSFLMVFGGSSVTAGHDNYFTQSYPMIVKKRMKPIFAALEIPFDVHNIAMGANNCLPYSLCYESMGGANADVWGWEQSYNCGKSEDMFELVARYAGWSKNRGLVYFSASGSLDTGGCSPSTDDPPYSDEDWTPEKAGLSDWTPLETELEVEKAELDKFNRAHESSSRFSGFMRDYTGIGKHGFNVWEANPHCSIPVRDVTGGTTTHTDDWTPVMKNGCSGPEVAACGLLKFETHESSIYGSGGGKKWHPSRAWHMLRGEAIAWLYTLTMLDALLMLQEARSVGKTWAALSEEYGKQLAEMQPDMPNPKRCGDVCHQKPMCYTNFQPHYSNMTLSSRVVGSHNWTVDGLDYGDWSLTYGYLDAKSAMHTTAGRKDGEIHFKISVGEKNPKKDVWVCGDGCGGALLHAEFFLDVNVADEKLVDYVPSPDRVQWHHKKYLGNECKELLNVPVGNHVLSITTSAAAPPTHQSCVSHIITWP